MRGCPLPSAQQRHLGVDEASKLCDQQAELPAADSVQWRARPTRTDRRPKRDATAHRYRNRFAEIRLCGASHRAPAVGRTLLLQPPPHAAIGRRERALSFALMPGCPARGRRSQTSTGPTLLRSKPNTRGPKGPRRVPQTALTLSRASASGADQSQDLDCGSLSELAPSGSTRRYAGWCIRPSSGVLSSLSPSAGFCHIEETGKEG